MSINKYQNSDFSNTNIIKNVLENEIYKNNVRFKDFPDVHNLGQLGAVQK